MSARGLHKLTGSIFVHKKQGLCDLCKHYVNRGDRDFGICHGKGKYVSAPKSDVKKPRCNEFEAQAALDDASAGESG